MDTTTHDDHDVRDGGRRTVVEARIVAPNDPLPKRNGTTPAWDVDNTSLETQHHDLHDGVDDILREAAHAVRAERQWCIALRQLLAKAQAAFRALGADSEGLTFYAYIALSILVIVAEAATGIANVYLISVPPFVRALLLVAMVIFPPAAALALGEALRPLRARHEYPVQYRVSAVLLGAFALSYVVLTYHLRAASVSLGAEADGLIPSGLEAWALCIIASCGYLLSIAAALTRESWQRFRLAAQIRRLRAELKAHERRLARAKADLARAGGTDDDGPMPQPSADPPPTRPPTGTVAATALVLLVLAAAPRAVLAASAGGVPRCGESLEWLRAAIPNGARVELMVTTQNLSDLQSTVDRLTAKTVLACVGPGTSVTVRAITATAMTDTPVWHGTVPGGSGPFDPYASVRGRRFLTDGSAAVDRALTPPASGGTLRSDLLGVLRAGADDWTVVPRDARRVAVIVASAFVQSRDVNLYRWNARASDKTDAVLQALRRDGTLPDLGGADVYIVGVTHGAPGMRTTNAEVESACQFMTAVTSAANGTLRLCSGTLPGLALASGAP